MIPDQNKKKATQSREQLINDPFHRSKMEKKCSAKMTLEKSIGVLNLGKISLIICILLLRLPKCSSKPAVDMYSDKVQNYLMEFGYLPKSNFETGNLRTEQQLIESIKTLQRFANLPVTGEVDKKTIELMKKPRCGQSDVEPHKNRRTKRYLIQGSKWSKTDITWSLVNQTMADLDAGSVRRILSEALDVWSRGSRLTFREQLSDEADIQVLFSRRDHGDGFKFDGPGFVLAHAFYPGVGRGGDAHFDAEEKWSLTAEEVEGTNLMGVAVHEFGHSLGLGHSSQQSAIMFPWYHGSNKFTELPEDDRLAIQQIYGEREKQWGPNHLPHVPATKSTTIKTTSTTPRSYYPDRDWRWRKQEEEAERRRQQRERDEVERRDKERKDRERKEMERKERDRKERERERKRLEEEKRRDWENRERERSRKRISNNHKKPDTCNTSYDAITIIRGELFIFKDRYLWRIGDNGIYGSYPHEINLLWRDLPDNFTHIDAVYENKRGKIVFFIGKMYYVFNANKLEYGYPKALTTLGLPPTLHKIDAVLVWGHNNKTFFFSDTMYWRFDEDVQRVETELDYPRDMSFWKGIGYHIDAAFQYKDGKTYFFKGKSFWQFDDALTRVKRREPELSAPRWMGCPRVHTENKGRLTASGSTIITNSAIILPVFTILVLSFNFSL